MFEPNDEAFLIQQIGQNSCVLFLGAGFCWGMKNRLGIRPPMGGELAHNLWAHLGYKEAFPSGMNLTKAFQLAANSKLPKKELQSFLEDRLLISDIPDIYNNIARPLWHRIYTTNIDDALPKIYSRASTQHFDLTTYPSASIPERDQFLDRVQCVYLHGRLPCSPDNLTFSIRQYAKRAGAFDRLYDVFVGDYSTHATIFLGTELDEPVFYQYLEAREGRGETARENRPRSFLISPSVTRATADLLDDFRIVPVKGTTEDFLNWLANIGHKLPTKDDLLATKIPTLANVRRQVPDNLRNDRMLKEFSAAFHEVPLQFTTPTEKSKYLLGSSPRWEDIHQNLDAPRDMTSGLITTIEADVKASQKLLILALLGTAGCGKSTVLRRIGLSLGQRGQRCYLSNCEDMPLVRDVVSVLEKVQGRVVLLFDNAEGALGYVSKLAAETQKLKHPPVLVVASRANDFYRKFSHVKIEGVIREEHVPNLSAAEIHRVLDTLDRNGLLGRLRAMSYDDRVKEFNARSGKQILVAMREATEGKGFDEIIQSEFVSLPSNESKVLYLCVALCTDAGYRIEKSEFIRCARVEPSVALDILERTLIGMVLRTGSGENLLLLRHRRIAEFLVGQGAARAVLLEAYRRLLPVLLPTGDETLIPSRRFRLYRELINHQTLFVRFASEPSLARDLYDELESLVSNDVHFYLQYGCYEMQLGQYDFATNYLQQARAIEPGNRFVINAQGQLLLKRAVAADSKEEAVRLRDEGKTLLVGNYDVMGHYDAHYYSIVAGQEFLWIKTWCSDSSERASELEELQSFTTKGLREFPRSRELSDLNEKAKDEYLRCALPRR